MEFMKYIVIALVGALAAVMANKGIAVFNDGFRPIYPEYFAKRIDRKALAASSFAISFGLVVGFGITASLGATILLAHSVLLMTDIIGTWTPETKVGSIIAGVVGAAWAVLLLVGLESVQTVFAKLPFNFLDQLGQVSSPIVVAFAIFPAVAVAYQRGIKRGLITAAATALAFILINFINAKKWLVIGGSFISLNNAGMAMLVGVVMMVVYAAKEKQTGESTNIASMFADNVKRIQRNWPWLVAMGGLLSLAACLGIMAGDPTSLNLVKTAEIQSAAIVAFVRAIGFIPLVITTGIVTGVYAPAGVTFVWAVGFVCALIPNAFVASIVAFIGGAAVMAIEVASVGLLAKFLDKFQGVRSMGDHIRNAMSQVLEVALLVGGMIAANAMVAGFGYLWVMGCWLLNKTGKKPIVVPLVVGPVAAIALGLFVNLAKIIGLM